MNAATIDMIDSIDNSVRSILPKGLVENRKDLENYVEIKDNNMAYTAANNVIIASDTNNRDEALRLLKQIQEWERKKIQDGWQKKRVKIDNRTFKEVWVKKK